MTQQELAATADVDLKTIYSLEAGHRWPIAKNRAKIEAALKWPPESLALLRDDGHLAPAGASGPARIEMRRPPMDPASEAVFFRKLAVIHDRMAAAERSEARLAKIEGRRAMVPTGIDVFPDSSVDARHWDDHIAEGVAPGMVAEVLAFGHMLSADADGQGHGRAAG